MHKLSHALYYRLSTTDMNCYMISICVGLVYCLL